MKSDRALPALEARRRFVAGSGAGVVAAAALAVPRRTEAQQLPAPPPSPPTQAWMEELQAQRPIEPRSSLSPDPARSRIEGEVGRDDHPAWDRFPPQDFYQVDIKQGSHSFHPHLPTQTIWGYDGQFPGPLFHARYGRPVLVRYRNQLPTYVQGYGSPDISVHLHNMHVPSESDGFPVDWWSPAACGSTLGGPGYFKDHHYPMVFAGIDQYGGIGDPREALGTCWYHDHRVDFTASNVYRGLAGFYLCFDEIDSGDERDPNPKALRLPSGEFDVPLIIADKQFTADGELMFDLFDGNGFVADKVTVNGKIAPVMRVARRKYRFRLLDGGPARFYDLQLRYNNRVQAVTFIANDGNLLPAPLQRNFVRLGPAERADIVVDFSRFPLGTEVLLTNRVAHIDGNKPENDFVTPVPILKFVIDREPAEPDTSQVPALLRELPPFNVAEAVQTRTFNFERDGGVWVVNNRIFNNRPIASPKKGTAEIWNLRNLSGGWAHPVHIHFEEGRILQRNGSQPPPHERGRKDVYTLEPGDSVRIFLRFRDFAGKYVMHCHNTVHEDHAMMVRYDIVP
jgi:FtsP/CotA-like multicopper oxidase with cupredoxin domain